MKKQTKKKKKTLCPVTVLVDSQVSDRCPRATCFIFAQTIDCGYTLEPPPRGGPNEYPQSIFWIKNNKIM